MDSIAMRQKAEGGKNNSVNSTREIKFSIASITVNPVPAQLLKGLYHKTPEAVSLVIQGKTCRERLDRLCWLTEVSALLSILT